jgi:hypothetical protein
MMPKSVKRFSGDIMLYLLIQRRIQISGRIDLKSSASAGSEPACSV